MLPTLTVVFFYLWVIPVLWIVRLSLDNAPKSDRLQFNYGNREFQDYNFLDIEAVTWYAPPVEQPVFSVEYDDVVQTRPDIPLFLN